MAKVRYQIELKDPVAHLIQVRLEFSPTTDDDMVLSLPAWIPGSYMIRDYAKHLQGLNACDPEGALPLRQLDKQSWRLSHRGLPVQLSYLVYAFDLSVRGNYLDDQLAALNPCALCLAVQGQTDAPLELTISAPQQRDWQVATGLQAADGTKFLGQGLYYAQTYQQLIDSPLLLGNLQCQQFMVAGIPHYMVLAGEPATDITRLCTDLTSICEAQVRVFGGLPADLTQYWFLSWVTDKGYGGLEHMNSTLLLLSHQDLPHPLRPDESTEAYRSFLGLCSHEYFHTWWVKRAKPAQFLPYQTDRELYTAQLWLYEGFTSYFDDLALVRSGKMTVAQYLTTLEQSINKVSLLPAESVQSVADSSFNAWTKYYKQDENAPNAVVSYYLKGSLIALCLQARLQQQGLSLEHLMQQAWLAFGASGKGSLEDDFVELTRHYAGHDVADALESWVHQAEPLPLEQCLTQLGLKVSYRARSHPKDWSGSAGSQYPARDFGAVTSGTAEGVQVLQVLLGSAAHKAGLMAQDLIIAANHKKVTEASLLQALADTEPGRTLTLHLFRRQRLIELQLPVVLAAESLRMLQTQHAETVQRWFGVAL
ncbi:PDZ domain-containing protein [Rheinheimera sp.]|uniref:M61 family metallopeptidase n=1 Tax=Rheinheimera sp. TaxID=1869214 RepID=UPI00307D8C5F